MRFKCLALFAASASAVMALAGPAHAARSITAGTATIGHPGSPATDEYRMTLGGIACEVGDTILLVYIRKDATDLVTGYTLNGSPPAYTWNGTAYPAHQAGTFNVGGKVIIRPAGGGADITKTCTGPNVVH